MKKNTKRYLAMLLAMALVLQQGGTITLADENESASEVVTEKTTEVQTAETKAPETKAPEPKQEETKAEPQTQPKPEAPKTEENKTPETKPEETNAPDTQTETQKDETATEPESGTEKATEQVTESEAVTGDSTTEGETQTPPEQEKESEKDSEPETEQKEEAKLDVSVMQEVFQKTVDGATVPMVKYTVKLANKAEAADAEDATLKVLLADALSYKKEEGETPELISFETLGKAIEATALESEELNEEQKSAYANSNVVLWKDQTIAAGAEKTFVFCAEVKDGQTDVNALKNLWLVNGDTVTDEKLRWENTDLLAAEEELPTEFTYEDDGMVVTATLAEGTVLPEGAQFVVEKVELSENEMAQVEAAAGEAKELANYVAYDMHFEVDGEEVEPQGEVAVKIAYKQANSTDFGGETMNNDAAEIQVIHLDEQAGAENVATGAEVGTDGAVSSAEFATDSFSVFVLSQLVDVDRSFLYEDDDVRITAVVGEDEEALNSNLAELKLEIIEDRESKEYKELEKAIEKKEKDNEVLLGFRAYKLTFLKDGEEVEPTGEIEVNIEHKTSSIPKDVPENLVSKTSFYQATEKGKVKELDAKLKNGRNHSVKEAEMTTGEVMLIEALAQEGTKMSRSDIIAGLGIAQNFAVFAIDFTNNNHMEGAVAVQNLNGSKSQLGNTDKVITYNPTKATLTINKTAVGEGLQNASYKFGIYKIKEDGTEELVTSVGNGGYVTVETNAEGVGSITISDIPAGTYHVYEIDDNNNPIKAAGEATVNKKKVDVGYTADSPNKVVEVESVGNKSYIENFKQDGCTVELFNDGQSTVVIGKGNSLTEHENNTSYQYIVGADGSKYLINKGKTTVEKVTGDFPIKFADEMSKLKGLSKKLANAIDSDSVVVASVPLDTDGKPKKKEVFINGEHPFESDENAWANTGLKTGGKFLVINMDCTGVTGDVECKDLKIDGQTPGNWNEVANSVIWNFFTKGSDGSIAPYTGKINIINCLGTILAPKATVHCESSMNGSVIGNNVDHSGCEIHHIKPLEVTTEVRRSFGCTNTLKEEKGSLEVEKTVAGNAGDKTRDFNFTVTLDDKSITGKFGDMEFKNGVAEFTLKDGESKTARDLPADVGYTIREKEANADGYTTDSTGTTGKITTGKTAEATFTNTKNEYGNLEVKKTVAGNAGEQEKDFHFTVTLDDKTVSGKFGDMEFKNGVAEFTLRHGETKTAKDLPAHVGYTVTEKEADADGYATDSNGASGEIPENDTAKAAFTNTKNAGGLIVKKTVAGNKGDKTKEFSFTVTLDDKTVTGTFGDMEFENGIAEFTLQHGQSMSATGLNVGVGYTVTEADYSEEGYVTTHRGETGTISDGTQTATFTNTKDVDTKLTVTKTFDGAELSEEQKGKITFTIYGPEENGNKGSEVAKFTYADMKGGSYTVDVSEAGTYTVEETNANVTGYSVTTTYMVGEAKSQKLAVELGDTASMDVINHYVRNTSIVLGAKKVFKAGESELALEGGEFTFSLTEVDKDGNVLAGGVSQTQKNKKGGAVEFDEIKYTEAGTHYYLIKEVIPTGKEKDGTIVYATNTYTVKVTVEEKDGALVATADKKAEEMVFTNTKTKIAIDKTDKDSGEKLAGAKLQIVDSTGKVVVGPWTTGVEPYDVTGKLELNSTYKLVELEAPNGYAIASPVEFSVNAESKFFVNGEEVTTITMQDVKNKVSILKVDESGAALAGAKLIIKDADGNVVSKPWTTDGNAHEITGLAKGSYTLSELEAPKGYQVSEDVPFEITGKESAEDMPIKLTMEDKEIVETKRSLRVTKELSMNDISPEAHIIVKSAIYHVALFEDEDRTKRVSDVKEIVFANQESSYATFKNLEADKTYYVGETDEYGTLIPGGVLSPNLIYYPTYDGGATFKFEGETTEGLAGFTNVYVEWPDYLYLSGQLTVTKKVLLNGEPATSTDTFYARVFSDAGLTQPVSEILTLSMAGGSEASVLVTNLPVGDKPGDSRKYYVAETDANGTPLDPGAVTEYTISVDKSEVTLSGSHPSDTVVITNDFTEKESEFESEEIESESETEVAKQTAPKTGDDTDFMKYLLLMALSAGLGGIAVGQKRRKARRTRK